MKKFIVTIVVLGAVLLTACSFNTTTEDKVSTILGDIYNAEKTYRTNQETLQGLEEAEQQLFNETMELTQEETDLLADQVKELQEMLEERLVKITEEAEAMKEAQALVPDLEKIEEQADGDDQPEIAKLKDAIQHRYQTHDIFVESYHELTTLQKQLYEMLLEEEADAATLEEQVDAVNEQNQKVMVAVEDFNQATAELNEIREEVYKSFKKNE